MSTAFMRSETASSNGYHYHVEPSCREGSLADRFLTAFAAIRRPSNYRFLLDIYARSSTRCARCAVTCQVYQATACWECHQDMYSPTSIFDHNLHTAALGANASCEKCHLSEHTRHSARTCSHCHGSMTRGMEGTKFDDMAPGYKHAMHGTCLDCHEEQAEQLNRPALGYCPVCHKTGAPEDIQRADLYPHQGG